MDKVMYEWGVLLRSSSLVDAHLKEISKVFFFVFTFQ